VAFDQDFSHLMIMGNNKKKGEVEKHIIGYQQAEEIYTRLAGLCQMRKFTTKRNWNEEETKLLNWALYKYSKKKNTNPYSFTN
jgi:hypothetical protein